MDYPFGNKKSPGEGFTKNKNSASIRSVFELLQSSRRPGFHPKFSGCINISKTVLSGHWFA